jgi:hypothetical protein
LLELGDRVRANCARAFLGRKNTASNSHPYPRPFSKKWGGTSSSLPYDFQIFPQPTLLPNNFIFIS